MKKTTSNKQGANFNQASRELTEGVYAYFNFIISKHSIMKKCEKDVKSKREKMNNLNYSMQRIQEILNDSEDSAVTWETLQNATTTYINAEEEYNQAVKNRQDQLDNINKELEKISDFIASIDELKADLKGVNSDKATDSIIEWLKNYNLDFSRKKPTIKEKCLTSKLSTKKMIDTDMHVVSELNPSAIVKNLISWVYESLVKVGYIKAVDLPKFLQDEKQQRLQEKLDKIAKEKAKAEQAKKEMEEKLTEIDKKYNEVHKAGTNAKSRDM